MLIWLLSMAYRVITWKCTHRYLSIGQCGDCMEYSVVHCSIKYIVISIQNLVVVVVSCVKFTIQCLCCSVVLRCVAATTLALALVLMPLWYAVTKKHSSKWKKYIFHYMVMPSINFGSQFCSFDFHTMHFSTIHTQTYSLSPPLLHSLFPSSPVWYARLLYYQHKCVLQVWCRTFLTTILCKKVIFVLYWMITMSIYMCCINSWNVEWRACTYNTLFTAILLILCALT